MKNWKRAWADRPRSIVTACIGKDEFRRKHWKIVDKVGSHETESSKIASIAHRCPAFYKGKAMFYRMGKSMMISPWSRDETHRGSPPPPSSRKARLRAGRAGAPDSCNPAKITTGWR